MPAQLLLWGCASPPVCMLSTFTVSCLTVPILDSAYTAHHPALPHWTHCPSALKTLNPMTFARPDLVEGHRRVHQRHGRLADLPRAGGLVPAGGGVPRGRDGVAVALDGRRRPARSAGALRSFFPLVPWARNQSLLNTGQLYTAAVVPVSIGLVKALYP